MKRITVLFIAFFLPAFLAPSAAAYDNGASACMVLGQRYFTNADSRWSDTEARRFSWTRGVLYVGTRLFIVENQASRIMAFNNMPTVDFAAADYVLGQADFGGHCVNHNEAIGANTFANPDGIHSDGVRFFVADPGNSRVLIFNSIPSSADVPADVAVGQSDFTSNSSGTSATKLHGPDTVFSDGTRLYIAEWYNHRVLIYNSIPTANNAAADVVVGQPNFTSNSHNQGGTRSAQTLGYPTGIWSDGTRLFIVDSGNGRVLIYNSIPVTNNAPADLVIGAPDFTSNPTATASASTFGTPWDVESDGGKLFVSDYGAHRVLIYNSIPVTNGAPADLVIGQNGFTTSLPNLGSGLYRPRDLSARNGRLVISDEVNNRVLIFNSIPTVNGASADRVVGQVDLNTNDQLSSTVKAGGYVYPNDMATDGTRLIVADGNENRVLIYNSFPVLPGTLPNVVVGQVDLTSRDNGSADATNLSGPEGVCVAGGRLYIADMNNSRVMGYNGIPGGNHATANFVLGQTQFFLDGVNQGLGAPTANTLGQPNAVTSDGTRLFVADTYNHRVLIYNTLPTTTNAAADVVVGQAGFTTGSWNQGGAAGANTLNYPRGVVSDGTRLFIADRMNNRVLVYNSIPVTNNAPANLVLGQMDFTSDGYTSVVDAQRMKWPERVWVSGGRLFVSDTGNSRVLVYNSIPAVNGAAADNVLGQADLTAGELNRGLPCPEAYTLNWPKGLLVSGPNLYIADSWNNRVVAFYDGITPTPTVTRTFTSTRTRTPTRTRTSTRTTTGTPTRTLSPTDSPTFDPSSTASFTDTPSVTVTPSATPTNTSTVSFTHTATSTPTATSTVTYTNTSTVTVTSTTTNTLANTPSHTSTPTPTLSSTASHTPTQTSADTPTNTSTETSSPSATPSVTDTPTPTSSPSATPSATDTSSAAETSTPTNTLANTPSHTSTPTPTPSCTASHTRTQTDTDTPTNTSTGTPSLSATPSVTDTPTPTSSPSATPSVTDTSSAAETSTPTNTLANTPSHTSTPTPTPSCTATHTRTQTVTDTPTNTSTGTPSLSATPSATDTPSTAETSTTTNTLANTPSHTSTPTPATSSTATLTWSSTGTFTPTPVSISTATSTNTMTTTETPTETVSPMVPFTPEATPSWGPGLPAGEELVIFPNPYRGEGPLVARMILPASTTVKTSFFTTSFRKFLVWDAGTLAAGTHDLAIWNPSLESVSNGLYFVVFEFEGRRIVRKLGILR